MIAADLAVIEYLLQAPADPPGRITLFREWKRIWKHMTPLWGTPVDRALAGGFAADRPAWAFAAGYQAAIQCLMPEIDNARIAAICITEKGGPHPARIQCRLTADRGVGAGGALTARRNLFRGPRGRHLLVAALPA